MSKRRKILGTSESPKGKKKPGQAGEEPEKSWIELVTETEPEYAIPVHPRFQAQLPDWTGKRQDPESEKWLGRRIWPPQEGEETSNTGSMQGRSEIGKGRPEKCSCKSHGSVKCANTHVTEERNSLKIALGSAFEGWGFDKMGEDVSKTWFPREEKKFEATVKKLLASGDKSSMEAATIRGKDRKSLVSYYFNVYLPRRMGKLTRSGVAQIDTDDEVINKMKKNDPNNNNSSVKSGTKSETDSSNKGSTKLDTSKDEASSSSQKPKPDKSQGSPGKNKYLSGHR
ncbi:hypothetical protein M9H77_05996 [Catharanthus roseus]|uniref:Uncharacterized protein n=1 Tax=Catharanthus roseus TaxID=4058 RepID=A0ACC0BQU8_CATRO|nr:hypothetical protein M9H77_05996 [Catharanthus roseus]